jgi:hypothetical protein
MAKVRQERLDPRVWREKASRLRECAKTTREAERQRLFPALAEQCEDVARELERDIAENG